MRSPASDWFVDNNAFKHTIILPDVCPNRVKQRNPCMETTHKEIVRQLKGMLEKVTAWGHCHQGCTRKAVTMGWFHEVGWFQCSKLFQYSTEREV